MKLHHFIYIFCLFVFSSCTSPTFNADANSTNTTTDVILKDGKFYYTGIIDKTANKKLISMYKKLEIKPEWINIKSKGGEVYTAMDFAKWIHKVKLNVEVNEYCLSSCANYIFTAANKKMISNYASIGFHGGLSSTEFELDTSEYDAKLAKLPKEQQEKERKAFKKMLKKFYIKANNREKQFFDIIGVSQSITTRGQSQVYYKLYGLDDSYQGWYYSIADLEKLGVDNITVIEPPWEPRELSKNTKMFKVEVKDIK